MALQSFYSHLPQKGVGYRTITGHGNQYGQKFVIETLVKLGITYHNQFQDSFVIIGDISKKHGEKFQNHLTHKNGLEADLLPICHDIASNFEMWKNEASWEHPLYDRSTTRSMIKILATLNPIRLIYFNDPILYQEGLTKIHTGHDRHLHVRFMTNRNTNVGIA